MALLAGLCLGCAGEPEPVTPPARYNVVLIVSDAFRQDSPGCYGGETPTPNLDRIARSGVRFANAYATSPWTPPSAVSIFTGNYATSYPHGPYEKTVKAHVPDEEVLLAEALRDSGYTTLFVTENVQSALHNCFQGLKSFSRLGPLPRTARSDIWDVVGAKPTRGNQLRILNYLMTVPAGENFFIAEWMLDPHEPFEQNRFTDSISVDASKLTRPAREYVSSRVVDGKPNEEETKYLEARYLTEVRLVDERMGHIWTMLEHSGLLETTYFVFTSDHGELFGEHGRFGHGQCFYEDVMRVPLIVAGPGLPAGKVVEAPVSLVGLMPTLKDLLGADYADTMMGESFADLMRGDDAEHGPLYFDDMREHDRIDALLDGGFKLVAMRGGGWELFDLANDPGETVNVAAANEARVSEMMETLLATREAIAERREANVAKLDPERDDLSERAKKELEKKLKSLGYIR